MAATTCDWRRCGQARRLAVFVGEEPGPAECRGIYCVGHASLKRRVIERQSGERVWLAWYGAGQPGRSLVGQDAPGRVLHHHVRDHLRGVRGR